MQVRVFLNTEILAMAFGYATGQPVVEVARYDDAESENAEAALHRAFQIFNVGDDPEFGPVDPRAVAFRERGNRSLSVGDLVELDRTMYACGRDGWDPVDFPMVISVSIRGITPLNAAEPEGDS
jgi:hypothetical protein